MTEEMRAEIPALRAGLAADPDWVADEIADFSGEQFSFERQEPVWARWSPEIQVRHMASVPCRYLLGFFGETLLERGYELPEVGQEFLREAMAMRQGSGSRVPPEICPDRHSLIGFMRPLFALCVEILDRERPEDLRAITCQRWVDPEATRKDAPENVIDYWRLAARLHPFGLREDSDRPGHFTIELCAYLRQIHWEILAHLRTVQRFKSLFGLPVRVQLPREGFLTLSKFYN